MQKLQKSSVLRALAGVVVLAASVYGLYRWREYARYSQPQVMVYSAHGGGLGGTISLDLIVFGDGHAYLCAFRDDREESLRRHVVLPPKLVSQLITAYRQDNFFKLTDLMPLAFDSVTTTIGFASPTQAHKVRYRTWSFHNLEQSFDLIIEQADISGEDLSATAYREALDRYQQQFADVAPALQMLSNFRAEIVHPTGIVSPTATMIPHSCR